MRVGERLAGRYELEARLGAGGMGEVWRAHDLSLGRRVAVKLLLAKLDGGEADARFRREARIAARLRHPGITVVHDVGEHEGLLFLVMELLKGADLGAVLAAASGRLLPLGRALDLLTQVAEALAAAHEQTVVHRDLKPANLFVQPGDRVKICDFGIARAAGETRLTGSGWVLGTAAYMAPEQCRGEDVGPPADLYALGCVLYELLVGTPPFGHGAPVPLAVRHVSDPAPELPPGTTADAGPAGPGLARLLTELLAKQPDAQPESAGAVAERLRSLATGTAPAVVPAAGPVAADYVETLHDPSPGLGVFGPPPMPTGTAPPAGTGGVVSAGTAPPAAPPGPSPDLARALLEEAVREAAGQKMRSGDQVEILGAAADAAARFDEVAAQSLLAQAERLAWDLGRRDGSSLSGALAGLARRYAQGSPPRAARLLNEAEQARALEDAGAFDWSSGRHVIDEVLALLDPEAAVRRFDRQEDSYRQGQAVLRHAVATIAHRDPERAETWLSRITDANEREAALADFARAYAERDLPTAVELASGIQDRPLRATALCGAVAAAVGAPTEQRTAALARARAAVTEVVGHQVARIRAYAEEQVREGRPLKAAAALENAEGLERALAGDPGAPPFDNPLLLALAAAERAPAPPEAPLLDTAAAERRAAHARTLPRPDQRALALLAVARDCTGSPDAPWLPEPARDPGTTARPAPTVSVPPPAHGAAGTVLWRTSSKPAGICVARPDRAVWYDGSAVNAMDPDRGRPIWHAPADSGVPAEPWATSPRIRVCAAEGTVYVAVEHANRAPGVRLLARDAEDGWIRWWTDLPRRRGDSSLFLHDGVLVHARGNRAMRLDPATGRMLGEVAVGGAPWIPGESPKAARRTGRSERPELGADTVPTPASVLHLLADDQRRYEAHSIVDGGDEVGARDHTGAHRLWTRRLTSRSGERCALQLVGIADDALYVKAADGGRNWRGRSLPPFVTALDVCSGRELWRWEHSGISERPAALVGNRLVLALPELTAIVVGGGSERGFGR
ncbi:protein kinase domain-containing protein [Streptomyces sp. NPDC055287]